jgi:hypothetical protein
MELAERYHGGGKWMLISAVLGLIGLVVTVIGFFVSQRDAFYSYLTAFAYFFAISIGALLFLMALYATNAKWSTVVRPAVEVVSGALPMFVVLFIPILFGLGILFPWVNPTANFSALEQHHFHGHKSIYLNLPFFLVRQVIYFAVMVFVGERLLRISRRIDDDGGFVAVARARRFATGAIPFVGLALTWASFDWLMSLTPFWYSTIFGAYYFAGAILSGVAVVILLCAWTREDRDLFGYWLTQHHLHSLGKLLLAFVAFWAYMGFSQLMLMWIANLPEEVPYFWVRLKTGWRPVAQFLIFGHFFLPFALLLPRNTKMIPRYLAGVSLWILFACAVDVYVLVMPALYPQGPHLSVFTFSSLLAVGGIASAFALWRARGRYLLPIKDPYLLDSLRYATPL